MSINKPTLIEFENERQLQSLIPPNQSNSFYTVGSGTINLFTLRSDPSNYRFELFIESGTVNTGNGVFKIAGDIVDINNPYKDLTIITNTKLNVNQTLIVDKGKLNVYGTLHLESNSELKILNQGIVTCYPQSTIIIDNNVVLNIAFDNILMIYGEIKIIQSLVNAFITNPHIYIDSSAYFTIDTSYLDRSIPSLVEYDNQLKSIPININTQDSLNYTGGRIGYVWKDGTPYNNSSIIDMKVLMGDAILGDFRLPIVGEPDVISNGFHNINNLIIEKNCTLHISENYLNNNYYNPQLYIGVIIGNNKVPGKCIVKGKIIADGIHSIIILDRGGSLTIEEKAEVYLKNNSIINSAYNDENSVLFINGTLIIDDVYQLSGFVKENIVLGEKGKIIILNPDSGTKRILFTTPDGILTSELYRLFGDNLDKIEYHISKNTGIGIDRYYEFYNRQMTKWYNDMRIEKAVKDGLLIWHDGGFIELDSSIIPWVNSTSTLIDGSKIFKSFTFDDIGRTKEVVNRLVFAGFNSIIFKFVYGNDSHEIKMNLEKIKTLVVYNNPLVDKYTINTDNSGHFFLRNMINNYDLDSIINSQSNKYIIDDTHTLTFEL